MEKQCNSIYWLLTRTGGFDGVSLQTFEYSEILNSLGIHIDIVTGMEETRYGRINYNGNSRHIIERLSFKHPDSRFINTNSLLKKGREVSEPAWKNTLENHKHRLKANLEQVLSLKEDTPVVVHNLISLRSFHPAAALAIKEIIEDNPKRRFLNFAPDSDWERPKNMEMLDDKLKAAISRKPKLGYDSSGPYDYKNLFHLTLNSMQRKAFIDFGINENMIFQIPDLNHFDSPELRIQDSPDEGFIEYLQNNCTYMRNCEITYSKGNIDIDTVDFLCNVRPIERKKIRTTIFLAKQFSLYSGKKACVIITHPNGDDMSYFNESVMFANKMGVELVYLGNSLKLSRENNESAWTLDDIYRNLAAMNSIGMVTSDNGGWENAINELKRAGIPVLMNPELNSYNEITEKMNFNVCAIPLTSCYDIIDYCPVHNLKQSYADSVPEIEKFVSWADKYHCIDNNLRKAHVSSEYKKAYDNLSSLAQRNKVKNMINTLYNN